MKANNTIRFLVVSVTALVAVCAVNVMMDAGAVLHDLTCPDHGWFASRT